MREVIIEGLIATVGGGTLSMEVAEAASAEGLTAITGIIGSVGMAGLALGGGYGHLTAKYGMALDNILGAGLSTRRSCSYYPVGDRLEGDGVLAQLDHAAGRIANEDAVLLFGSFAAHKHRSSHSLAVASGAAGFSRYHSVARPHGL
jgi:FAD/FMN-containing dehydrogenase